MYSFGEIGYGSEGSSSDLSVAIDGAVAMSVDISDGHIGIWSAQDDLLYVVIEGDVFKLVE